MTFEDGSIFPSLSLLVEESLVCLVVRQGSPTLSGGVPRVADVGEVGLPQPVCVSCFPLYLSL